MYSSVSLSLELILLCFIITMDDDIIQWSKVIENWVKFWTLKYNEFQGLHTVLPSDIASKVEAL